MVNLLSSSIKRSPCIIRNAYRVLGFDTLRRCPTTLEPVALLPRQRSATIRRSLTPSRSSSRWDSRIPTTLDCTRVVRPR